MRAFPTSPLERPTSYGRLYVACQLGGWGLWTVLYIGLMYAQGEVSVKGEVISRDPGMTDWMVVLATNGLGLLLTHLFRVFVRRREWAQLPLVALLPRMLLSAVVLSAAWTACAWPLLRFVTNGPGEVVKISHTTLVLYNVFSGSVLLFVWEALYFGYHFFDRSRRSEIERWRLQSTAKEAELRALKSQVNPHFIFNSLNSLRALIEENPPQARDAVTRLANLLRYSLKAGQLETVALADEMRVVDDYLALEQVRLEERLRVRLDVTPLAATAAVPPMLVQTLVENAVKYGVAPRREGGEITLEARAEGGRLRLRITNPGSLNARSGSTGLGLRNAAERLRLIFGERARLDLVQDAPDLVAANVELPLTTFVPTPAGPAVAPVP